MKEQLSHKQIKYGGAEGKFVLLNTGEFVFVFDHLTNGAIIYQILDLAELRVYNLHLYEDDKFYAPETTNHTTNR